MTTIVVLHPALRIPGAGQRHVVVAREADDRIVLTRCGVRAALTELVKPGAWYGNCREGCAR